MLEVSQHFKWASKANAWTEAIRSLSAKNTMTGFITNSLAQTFALFFSVAGLGRATSQNARRTNLAGGCQFVCLEVVKYAKIFKKIMSLNLLVH